MELDADIAHCQSHRIGNFSIRLPPNEPANDQLLPEAEEDILEEVICIFLGQAETAAQDGVDVRAVLSQEFIDC